MQLIKYTCVALAIALTSTNVLAATEKSKTEQLKDIMPTGVNVAHQVMQIKQDTCKPANGAVISADMSEDTLFETVKSDPAFSYLLALNSILDNENEFKKVMNVAKQTVDCNDSQKWVTNMYSYFKSHPGFLEDPYQKRFLKLEAAIDKDEKNTNKQPMSEVELLVTMRTSTQ